MIVFISNCLCYLGVMLCEIPYINIHWIISVIICILLCCSHFYLYCAFYKNSNGYLILKREIIYFIINIISMFVWRYILNAIYIKCHAGDNYGIFLGLLFWIIYNISKIFQLLIYVLVRRFYKKRYRL